MMQNTPLVSVIVPAHNAADYLGECVDSIRSQTLADWELILVDDASDDATGAMCDAFAAADGRIRAFHIAARHQSATRNYGTARAKGRYICYLDSDDAYGNSALELMVKAMEEFDADMCVAGYVDGTGNTLPQMPQPQWAVCNGTEALRNILYQRPGWHCSVCARMFTRDMISRAGQFDEALFYEDLEIAPRHCMAAARVAMTEAPLYFYRTNPSSFMNTWHSRRLHSLAVVDRIASRCAVDSRLAAAARSRRFSAYCNIMGLAARNGDRATARSCWTVVKSLRGAVLSDPETRLKNKIGALLAFAGCGACTLLMKWLGK